MRIAAFYICLFAAGGIFVPYLPAYYRSLGFTGKQISLIASLPALAMIFVPPVWGFVADRTRRVAPLLSIACFGAALSFSFTVGVTSFPVLVMVMAAAAFFSSTISSLADTVAMAEAKRMGLEFAWLRGWGSVGFIASSFAFGYYLESGGAKSHALGAIAGLMGGYALLSLLLHGNSAPPTHAPPSFADAKKLLSNRPFLLFLLMGMVHWSAISPYYLFFAARLEESQVGLNYVGIAFSLGVVAEIMMMWGFGSVKKRVALFPLLALSSVLSVVRWTAVAYVDNGPMLAIVQTLHAFTFASFYLCSVTYLDQLVPVPLRATGRALYTSIVMGLGGVIGNKIAGDAFDSGGARLAFLTAALTELLVPLLLRAAWKSAQKANAIGTVGKDAA